MSIFQYNHLPDDVHELVLSVPTTECLDECFVRLDAVFFDTPPTEPLLLLSDITQSGVPPISHLWSLARQLLAKYPRKAVTCNAVIHNLDNRLYSIFMVVMQQLAGLYSARVQFFRAHERERAIAWLLENQNTRRKPLDISG